LLYVVDNINNRQRK